MSRWILFPLTVMRMSRWSDCWAPMRMIPTDDREGAVVAKVRRQIDASPMPHLPLLWTEWNVTGKDDARETPYVGPALANVIRECDGNVQYMSFWTFSEVFEENGPASRPFTRFGIRAMGGINKPAFYDFALLHHLGTERIANSSRDTLITKLPDGGLAIAVWNLVDPGTPPSSKQITLHIAGVAPDASASIQRVDETHGNVMPFYKKMGSPVSPTRAQVEELNRDTAFQAPEQRKLSDGNLTLDLGTNALVLVKVHEGAQTKAGK